MASTWLRFSPRQIRSRRRRAPPPSEESEGGRPPSPRSCGKREVRAPCSGGSPGGLALRLQPEQLGRVAAEDRDLVVVTERRGGEDVIDRMLLPRDRMIAAEHDLADADLGHQVAQRFGREDQRVEMKLVEILGRLLLELDVGIAVLRRHEARMVGARRVGRKIATAVGGDDLEARKTVERAFEDQLL